MYKEIILIITLTILILSCSEIKKPAKIKFKTAYTNVIALYARSKPSLKSKKINLLPFGTKIKVRKTKFTSVYQGHKAHWYYEHYTKGYVFGKYIQKTLPKKHIEFKVYMKSISGQMCTCNCVVYRKKILLTKNKFKYYVYEGISGSVYYYNPNYYVYKGIYHINKNKIILQSYYSYKRTKKYDSGKLISDKIHRPKQKRINLIFIAYIPGFINEKDKKVLKIKEYYLDRKKKVFISYKDLKKEEMREGLITRYGYFFY